MELLNQAQVDYTAAWAVPVGIFGAFFIILFIIWISTRNKK